MGRRKQDLGFRFWAKVDQGPPEDCWCWYGAKTSEGYGQIWRDGKPEYAHRVAWELATGRKPRGEITHNCEERSCVNPNHLEEV